MTTQAQLNTFTGKNTNALQSTALRYQLLSIPGYICVDRNTTQSLSLASYSTSSTAGNWHL